MLTLEQFNDFVTLLALHDWHYDYSDDMSVWRKGSAHRALIDESKRKHPMYHQAYEAWHTYIYRSHRNAENRQVLEQTIKELRAELLITA